MTQPVIDASVLLRAEALGQAFLAARPFRHVVIPDFLDRAACERLLADFPRFEARHALNERGDIGGKAVRMDVRDISEGYRALDRHIQSDEFLGFVSHVTGIPDLLYDPDYIGGGTHENRHGQGLDAHVDFNYHPRTRWHRRLNLIVYLNPQWQESWGGALELHSDPWSPASDTTVPVAPLFNQCAIFETTESSWHGFSQIDLPEAARSLSRKSFAIYLYTRERPRVETAPPHATIYVPDTTPATWSAGRVLSDTDTTDLVRGLSSMRTQLRYLYDREKRFGAQIQTLENALDEAHASRRLELQGYATQPRGARGVWADGWAAAAMSACFIPVRPTRELQLELWSPPQLRTEQTLRIRLGDSTYTQSLRPGLRTPVKLSLRAAAGTQVELSIDAAQVWKPSTDPAAGDQRELAYKIISASLQH